jgi:ABC-type nitrate/sulfonate/bicarbonate transport system substrate-binding protein
MSLADFWKEMCEARKLICGAFERKYMRLIAKLSGIFLLFVVMGCRGERIGKEPSEIAVGVLEHGSAIPIIVAEKEGIFRRHNLKVKIFKVSPSEHMPSLLRGDYSVLSASSFPVIFSAAQQNPGRIQCYMTGGESSEGDVLYGIVIPRGSNALSLRDLVGKKIGSASKFTSINLRNVLASKFGEVNPVTKIQELSDRSLLLDGLDKGTFEAAVMDQPALSQAIGRGYKVIERNFRAKYLIDPYWSGAGVVDRAWAISHRNSFEAYLDSLDEALRMCKQEPDRVKKEFLNFFNVGDIQPDSIGMYVYPAARFSPPRAFVADLTKLLLDNKLLAGPVAEDIFYKK